MKAKPLLLLLVTCHLSHVVFSQVWTPKNNLGGMARMSAVGFSIGKKGYVGTGNAGVGGYKKDFWEWDQATGSWTQKADFAGTARWAAVGFAIGNKGYIGTGNDVLARKDFWEWNQGTNTWIQKADFGGSSRFGAVAFSIGTKGYIGTGGNAGTCRTDFWEYTPGPGFMGGTWTQRAPFSGAGRCYAGAFSIGTKGYIGAGASSSGGPNDFWQWDQTTNLWTQIADLPGPRRSEVSAFHIGNYGYVGLGTTSIGSGSSDEFWKYDPSLNLWTAIPNFGGGINEMAPGFSIGCYGYVVTGFINDDYNNTMKRDLWEYYDPADTTCGCNSNVTITNVNCNGGNTGSATVVANGGTAPYTYSWSPLGGNSPNVTGLPAGTYTVIIADAVGCTQIKTITITEPPMLTSTVTFTNANCTGGNNGSAAITSSGGAQAYTYSWLPGGATTAVINNLSAGTYSVIITDGNGCTLLQTASINNSGSMTASAFFADTCGSDNASATATINAGTLPYTYAWSPSGGNNQTATGLSSGSYTCSIVDANGCSTITTITVIENTDPIAIAGANVTIYAGASTTLSSTGGGTYSWSPAAGLSNANIFDPIASPSVTTEYCVTVTDVNGCTDMACVTVVVEDVQCGELFIPNAFSPNGDNQNDVLFVHGNCIQEMQLIIYNRWGEEVFASIDPLLFWDGTCSGSSMNTAVFVYYLNATLKTGEKITKRGNVSLIK